MTTKMLKAGMRGGRSWAEVYPDLFWGDFDQLVSQRLRINAAARAPNSLNYWQNHTSVPTTLRAAGWRSAWRPA